MSEGTTLWRYRRRFSLDGIDWCVTMRSRTNGLYSELTLGDAVVAEDYTPALGPDAVRNHTLTGPMPDGSHFTVEAGWISTLNVGIAVRRDGALVHESHPGRTIAYPEKMREAAMQSSATSIGGAIKQGWREGLEEQKQQEGYDPTVWKRNKIPLAVDIGLGLVFFVIAKLTDLTTAAIAGAAVGIALLIIQRITKIDLLGGLAMFGIVMMLISAGLAYTFDSDDAVKYRSTFMGLLGATLFFTDGAFGGKRLVKRLMVYLPYTDLDPVRLGLGMGIMGLVMAGVNQTVAMLTSTEIWLYYTTFGDFVLTMALILLVFRWARGQMARDVYPAYRNKEERWPEEAAGR